MVCFPLKFRVEVSINNTAVWSFSGGQLFFWQRPAKARTDIKSTPMRPVPNKYTHVLSKHFPLNFCTSLSLLCSDFFVSSSIAFFKLNVFFVDVMLTSLKLSSGLPKSNKVRMLNKCFSHFHGRNFTLTIF